MIRPQWDEKTVAQKESTDALSAMQAAAMRGEIPEADYNAHREAEAVRLIALGVMPGKIAARLVAGVPTI